MQFHRAKSTPDIPLELTDNKSKPLQFKPRKECRYNRERNSITIKKSRSSSKRRKSKKKHEINDDDDDNNNGRSQKKRHNKIKRTRSCTNLNSKRSKSKRCLSLNPKESDKLNSSQPCYVIKAHYKNNILAINVHDSSSSNEWRQEFTKDSFKHIKIYKVAKTLINCIKKTGDNEQCKEIKIFEYNAFCYVTLINSCLPSFALRPIDKDNMMELKEEIEPIQESDDDNNNKRRMAIIQNNNKFTIKLNGKHLTNRKESNDTLYSNISWISSSPSAHSNVITSISIDSHSTLTPSTVLNKKQGPGFNHHHHQKHYHKDRCMPDDTENIKYDYV